MFKLKNVSGMVTLAILSVMILTCSHNKSTNSGGIPAAPSRLIGETLSPSSIRLSWIDNSDNENGFAIFRSQFGVFDHSDTVGAGQVLFTEQNLEDSTSYTFHVMAFNNAGSSASSNNAVVTTTHAAAAPLTPNTPFPSDNASGMGLNTRLTWQCSDPNNDPLSYDVYIGPQNPPSFAARQDSLTYRTPSSYTGGTTYYWRIVAINSNLLRTSSPVWRFTTSGSSNQPPSPPSNPSPPDSATSVAVSTQLTWQDSDPEGDSLTYDVFFGTVNPPPFVVNQAAASYSPSGGMAFNTTYYWKIVAHDNHQNQTTGPIWLFTTAGAVNQPPNPPSNPSPPNGQTNVPTTASLSWQGSDPEGDSLNFDLYFGSVNPPPFVRNQVAATYTPPSQLAGGTVYYWKIVAHDNHQNQTAGQLWSFSTLAANQPPVPPSNPVPADGQYGVAHNISLSWQASDPDGDSLNFDVYFGPINPPPFIGNQIATSFTPIGGLADSITYYWKIVARDSGGLTASGPIWQFTSSGPGNQPPSAPSNPSPINGATGVAVNASLSWTGSDPEGDPLNYDVYFGIGNPPPFIRNQTASSYSPPGGLGNNTIYYWQIVAHDNHGHQTASAIWSFTTVPGNQPPATPSAPSPANSQLNVPLNTILSWQDTDPENDPMNFDLYFGTANPPPFVRNQTSMTYAPPGNLTGSTTYYWQIIAHDNHSNQTTGPVWSFTTIGNQPPAVPSNPHPTNGAVDVGLNTNLTWQDSDPEGDPLTYDVYFGTNTGPPIVSTGQSSTAYTPAGLQGGTSYYWKIVAHDTHSNQTAGPLWIFITAVNHPPAVPNNPSPADGAVGVQTDASIIWQDSDPDGDPLNYDVYFGTATPPTFIHNQSSNRYNPPGRMQNNTVYYWQIVAHDNQGNQTQGPIWHFTTVPPTNSPPLPPSNPSPPSGSLNIGVDTVLTWQDSDPDGDTLNFDVNFGNINPPPLVGNQATMSYRPATLANETTYYWSIVAHDNHQNQTAGPVWHFRTIIANSPPLAPSNPFPANGATGVDTTATLSWQDSDPDGDTLSYNISFGTVSPPPFVVSQPQSSYSPALMTGGQTYFWQIVANDNHNHQTAGPIWSFTTIPPNLPPLAASNPSPANGATGVDTAATLSWQDSDPDGDPLIYNINFGTVSPPPFVVSQPQTTYSPGLMLSGQTYFWQIVANDNHNHQTAGPIWSFTTVPANLPPLPASNPSPPDSAPGVAHTVSLSWVGSDPDGDTLNYDIYFGTSTPPPFIQNQIATIYTPPDTLLGGTTYFWEISSKDRIFTTPGPIWSFTTAP